jgi:aryl-alcohol dehydrogenase-like predicted oxidoreductase
VHPITALQSEFSLWTRDVVTDGVLDAARELGTGLVAYSPLGRGMLTGEIAALDNLAADDVRRVMPRFADGNLDTNLALLDSLRAVAEQHDATAGQIALAWVLAQGEDVIPIPGTKRLDYLAQNLAAAAISLSAEQLEALDAAFRPGNVQGARYPAATLPDTRSTRGGTSS